MPASAAVPIEPWHQRGRERQGTSGATRDPRCRSCRHHCRAADRGCGRTSRGSKFHFRYPSDCRGRRAREEDAREGRSRHWRRYKEFLLALLLRLQRKRLAGSHRTRMSFNSPRIKLRNEMATLGYRDLMAVEAGLTSSEILATGNRSSVEFNQKVIKRGTRWQETGAGRPKRAATRRTRQARAR